MSVRRLADKQPESFAFTPENQAWAEKEIAKYPPGRQASAILALLWRAQKQNDYWLPRAGDRDGRRACSTCPYIRALEVATFYTMFNLEPVGRHHVQLCGTTPCMLRGAGGHQEGLPRTHRRRSAMSRADGAFSWIEVECLGACCNAPMVQINDDYYEDLTPENFAKLLDDLAAGRPVKIGLADRPRRLRAGRAAADRADDALRRRRQAARRRKREPPQSAAQSEERAMLEDKDRIFTNLYGLGDRGLRGRARARPVGQHQGADRQGPRLDHQRDEGLGPARPRRRRLPDRPQMVVHAQDRSIPSGRIISSSTPTNPSPAPARIARSCATTRTPWSRAR